MEAVRISKEELREKIEKGEDLVLLDVRSNNSYNSSSVKITGALRKDPMSVDSWYVEVPKDRLIVTYCA